MGMRGWLAVAALGAAFVAMPLWAQRRGGGSAGFGGHAGFASRGAGFSAGAPMMAGRGPSVGNRSQGFSGGWHGPHFGTGFNRPFRSPYYPHHYRFYSYYPYGGYGYAYPYYGYPGYYDDYDSGSYYDSAGADYGGDAEYAQEEQARIDQLEDEVNRLRQEREARRPVATSQAASTSDLHSVTQLVFRDKHSQEVQNYAIVGQTFWIFDQQRTTRVPLSDLDIPATVKANDARGVDFELPR